MKKLITGATGLVGSHVLSELLKQGEKVCALKRETSDISSVNEILAGNQIPPGTIAGVEWVVGDVLDLSSLEKALEGVDEVFHCAAMVSFHPEDSAMMLEINVEGTANVVNLCLEKGIKKLCYVSSIAALGNTKNGELITEKTRFRSGSNESRYSLSKHLSEMEVWRGIEEGLNAVIVNPCIIVGPGAWGKSSTDIFPKVWNGHVKFFPEGGNAFVDVRDVAVSMINLMKSGIHSERFILMSENLSYKTFFEMVADGLGRPRAKIRISPFLAELGWRAEFIRSKIVGRKALITKEIARSACQTRLYSSEKIKKALGTGFKPITQSVKETCSVFLREMQKGNQP